MHPTDRNAWLSFLVRIDQQIANAKAILADPSDDDTRDQAQTVLAQMVEERPRVEAILATMDARGKNARMAARFHRIMRWAGTTFFTSLALFVALAFVIVYTSLPDKYLVAVGVGIFAMMVLSGATYFGAVVVRECVVAGWRQWRFTVANLLLVTTLVAVLLGMLVVAARRG